MNAAFLKVLESGRRFLLAGHERPDGDCIGAQVALYHLLQALGKHVAICNPDPAPGTLDFLGEHTPLHFLGDGYEMPEFDVLVLLDCAHLGRLGRRMNTAVGKREPTIVVIDHHVGSEHGDGDVCFVDSDSPATGALVLDLYRHYKVPVPPAAAEGVFVSLISDTGWFRYSNTTAQVFAIAAELVGSGVEPSRIYDAIHRRNHPESVEFLADALGRWEIDLDGRFGYALIDRESVEKAGRIGFDLDSLMDPVRSIGGIQVVAMFKDNGSGGVKLSLRASGDVDVQAIASSFGGGGHKKAAGATLHASLTESLVAVRAAVKTALDALDGARR